MSKEQILEIADRQMKAGGYVALNFREISEELGISKANVHHHFKNKETLAIEVTNHYTQMNFEGFEQLDKQTGNDFIAFIKGINQFYWNMAKQANTANVCVCSQIVNTENVPESLRKVAFRHFDTMRSILIDKANRAIEAKMIQTVLSGEQLGLQALIFMRGMMSISQTVEDVKIANALLGDQVDIWFKSLK